MEIWLWWGESVELQRWGKFYRFHLVLKLLVITNYGKTLKKNLLELFRWRYMEIWLWWGESVETQQWGKFYRFHLIMNLPVIADYRKTLKKKHLVEFSRWRYQEIWFQWGESVELQQWDNSYRFHLVLNLLVITNYEKILEKNIFWTLQVKIRGNLTSLRRIGTLTNQEVKIVHQIHLIFKALFHLQTMLVGSSTKSVQAEVLVCSWSGVHTQVVLTTQPPQHSWIVFSFLLFYQRW